MRTILLITEQYPFGQVAETFLANELPFLSAHFDVAVLPTNFVAQMPQRPVPDGVRVIVPKIPHRTRLGRQFNGLFGIPRMFRYLSKLEVRAVIANPKRLFWCLDAISQVLDVQAAIHRVLEDESIAIIYSYWFNDAVTAALRERYSRGGAYAVVSRAHGYDIFKERHGGVFPFRDWAMTKVDCVFPISLDGQRVITDSYPEAECKVILCRLGTMDHGIAVCPNRNTCNSGPRPLRLVSLSSIASVKRLDLIIDALAELELMTTGDITWTHIGNGTLLEDMRIRAQNKLRRVVWSFVGYMPNSAAIQFLLREAPDFLLSTSDSEGIPVSMMEAISLGIPVVARPVGGVREIVIENVTGFFTQESPTPSQVAATILQAASLPSDEAVLLRQSTRRYWEENYQAQARVQEFAEDLERLLA